MYTKNKLPLNDEQREVEVNVLECYEKTKSGEKHFCWITDLELTEKNVAIIAKGGRSRWRIESAPQAHKAVMQEELSCV